MLELTGKHPIKPLYSPRKRVLLYILRGRYKGKYSVVGRCGEKTTCFAANADWYFSTLP